MNGDKLKLFLFILMRDYLPFGDVEKILVEHVEKRSRSTVHFDNDGLGAYVDSLVKRLS
mgnify:CR=1 FL=1